MDARRVYLQLWKYEPPPACVEMHQAGFFEPRSSRALSFAVFEFFDAKMLAEGDAFVSEQLVPGLVPIGGDRTGDRWCFDGRPTTKTPGAVVHCPHDGGGAVHVAPDFTAFVFRLCVENLALLPLFERWGKSREEVVAISDANLTATRPWLGPRAAVLEKWIRSSKWPEEERLESHLREDAAFAALPTGPFEHFR